MLQDINNEQGWLTAVFAPTGLAAFNVNGHTIHRFFKLPVFNDNNDTHWPLSDQNIKLMRQHMKNLILGICGNYDL